jgi:hypothetical protein
MAIIKTAEATYVAARTTSSTGGQSLNNTTQVSDWTTSQLSGKVGTVKNNSSLYDSYIYNFHIKFTTPMFTGECTSLSIRLKVKSSSYTETKVGITISNDTTIKLAGAAYDKESMYSYYVYKGIHTISDISSSENYVTINIPADRLLSNTTYLLAIRAYETITISGSMGVISGVMSYSYWHCIDICDASSDTVTLTLTYEAPYGCAKIHTSASATESGYPYIFVDGEWKPCSPYVYLNGEWHECEE